MTDSCVEELEVQPPTLKHFIKVVQKHGNVFMLNELYAHDQKQPNEIILVSIIKLMVLGNKELRKIIGPKTEDVTSKCF
jgi:hypothetical protein